MSRLALVYRGPGASSRSTQSVVQSLKRSLAAHENIVVETATASDLLSTDDEWESSTVLLCFPGGADVPYCNSLGPSGFERIRRYVEGGGFYLGICAGAYFASGAVTFEPGTALEVVGDRHLKFFRGVARGAAFPGFDYHTERGAVSARIRYLSSLNGDNADSEWRSCLDYVNGGPYWMIDDADDTVFRINSVNHLRIEGVDILATYEDLNHAVAAMRCHVGDNGGVAVLCASHPELHHTEIADPESVGDELYVEHVARLKKNLFHHEAARAEFFDLLVAAGMEATARQARRQ